MKIYTPELMLILLASLLMTSPCHALDADSASSKADPDTLVLEWPDLIPEDFSPEALIDQIAKKYDISNLNDSDETAMKILEEMQTAMASAPVKDELDGKRIKLPGFTIPLESNGETATEFLLVPYFGACIHVPPPPSNQIVYGISEKGVTMKTLFEPVWVTGKLSVKGKLSEFANAGYTLSVDEVEPYQ
ncbi:MAG: DUF3299 domain-containing protein [Gammaproteobacteria bacterium]